MKDISYRGIDHFILFGGGLTLLNLAELLRERGFLVDIFTAPRHAEEPLDEGGNTFAQLLERGRFTYTVTEDINREVSRRSLLSLIKTTTMGLGFGEAWSFSDPILEAFSGYRLLDFMGIPLPRYRGGAHYTWMIQRGDKEGGFHIQVINADMVQGQYDSGELLFSRSYRFPDSSVTPMDYFYAARSAETEFILTFIEKVMAGDTFSMSVPDESRSLFLPRLNTRVNGWVDWSWSGEDIRLFIDSFDDPYPGASTQWNGQTVHLMGVRMLEDEPPFHPFQSGIVTRIDSNDSIVVATTSGSLIVEQVLNVSGEKINRSVQLGERFHTSREQLEAALSGRAVYTPIQENTGINERTRRSPFQLGGDKVLLRPISLSDCTERYVAWLQDSEVNQYLETRWTEQTLESVTAFVENILLSDENVLFAIEERLTGIHIGNIKLGPINRNHGSAELSYFIGEKSCWGKGYATEAIKLVTEYAFESCSIEYMLAGAYENNHGSIRALEKAGYHHQGRFRKQFRGPRGREDHIYLGAWKE